MLYALELLRDRSSAEASEQMQDTEPEWHLLNTPTLQLRASALETTAALLRDLLPGERFCCITHQEAWLRDGFSARMHLNDQVCQRSKRLCPTLYLHLSNLLCLLVCLLFAGLLAMPPPSLALSKTLEISLAAASASRPAPYGQERPLRRPASAAAVQPSRACRIHGSNTRRPSSAAAASVDHRVAHRQPRSQILIGEAPDPSMGTASPSACVCCLPSSASSEADNVAGIAYMVPEISCKRAFLCLHQPCPV